MAKKRGHGEGSITQRKDGRWMAQLTTEYDPSIGKRRRVTYYGKTKKEVLEKLRNAQLQLQNGSFVEPNKITFETWISNWHEVYVKNRVRISTWENYGKYINAYIKPIIGYMFLKDIRPEHLQRFYNELLVSGRRDGKGGLSPRSVSYIHTIINMALKQAVKEQIIMRNMAESVDKPKQKKHEFKPFSIDEMNQFLIAAREQRLFPAFLVEWGTGLRCGELLGLKWGDIDLERGYIAIRRGLIQLKEGLAFSEPKTEKSRRIIPLPVEVTKELKVWKIKQAQEKLFLDEAYLDNDLVFCEVNGIPLAPRNFTRLFDKIIKEANLPRIRFHDLRHTHATTLLTLGEHPKIVQERLGHSTITMTLDTYSHIMPGLQEKASSKLSEILNI